MELSGESAIEAKDNRHRDHLDSQKHKANVEKAEGRNMAGADQGMASGLMANYILCSL